MRDDDFRTATPAQVADGAVQHRQAGGREPDDGVDVRGDPPCVDRAGSARRYSSKRLPGVAAVSRTQTSASCRRSGPSLGDAGAAGEVGYAGSAEDGGVEDGAPGVTSGVHRYGRLSITVSVRDSTASTVVTSCRHRGESASANPVPIP
ncbi:hypothetical protein [Micromonospora terminaliae]|uniref:Uncharacterized protein n=1 Tax=Micromonospora terminaliae TaxID=1914461 RepID=A0AAJ2ZDC8_9ACTN|nr:hypothetical protein [Micromonospora terminaliae]NES27922.1 hypothetical protein [Micromonospora terminaliae]